MPIDHQANKSTATNDVPLMVEKYDGIAWLTLNRPRQYNALSSALLDHLHTAFDGGVAIGNKHIGATAISQKCPSRQ